MNADEHRFFGTLKKKPITDGYEGMRVLKVLNESQFSLDENGRKIYLGESPDLSITGTVKREAHL
jgi:hypothetical protein